MAIMNVVTTEEQNQAATLILDESAEVVA